MGLVAILLILPMDELGRHDLDIRSSRLLCYTLAYDSPIDGLAALYIPTLLVLRPNAIASLMSWGAAIDTGAPKFTHSGNWSMFGPSSFRVRYDDVTKPLGLQLVFRYGQTGLIGRASLFLTGRPALPLRSVLVIGREVPCSPQRIQRHHSAPEMLTPGKYRLILIAGRGGHVGARAAGTLTLFPTSGLDRSPTKPNERARPDTADYPMYGATNLDFAHVGAPVFASDKFSPSPMSLDPLHPGVLVHFDYSNTLAGPPHIEILIGTLNNVRAVRNYDMADGAGIVLSVRRIAGGRVFGDWGPYGIVVNGSGEFYLEPFESNSLDIIERPTAPPSRAAPAQRRIPGAETVESSPARASQRRQSASASRSRSSRATAYRLTVRR